MKLKLLSFFVLFGVVMVFTAPSYEKHISKIDQEAANAYQYSDKNAVDVATESIKDNLLFEDYVIFTRSYILLEQNRINISFGIFGRVIIINKLF